MELRVIIGKSFEDYKSNPVVVVPRVIEFLADGVIVFSLFLFWMSLLGFSFESSLTGLSFTTLSMGFVSLSVAGLLILMVTASARAAIISMALQVFTGKKASIDHAVEGVKASTHKVFLYFVFLFGALVILWMVALLSFRLYPPLLFFFIPLNIAAFILLYLFTFLTPQQIVAKGFGVVDGLIASADFVMKNYRMVIGYGVFVMLLALGAWLVPYAIFFIINEITRYHPFLNLAAGIFHSLLSLAIGIALSPYLEMIKTYMVVGEIYGRAGENKKEEIEEDAGESQTPRIPE